MIQRYHLTNRQVHLEPFNMIITAVGPFRLTHFQNILTYLLVTRVKWVIKSTYSVAFIMAIVSRWVLPVGPDANTSRTVLGPVVVRLREWRSKVGFAELEISDNSWNCKRNVNQFSNIFYFTLESLYFPDPKWSSKSCSSGQMEPLCKRKIANKNVIYFHFLRVVSFP